MTERKHRPEQVVKAVRTPGETRNHLKVVWRMVTLEQQPKSGVGRKIQLEILTSKFTSFLDFLGWSSPPFSFQWSRSSTVVSGLASGQ